MGRYILHHNGVFNEVSTVTGGVMWLGGFTRAELEAKMREMWGEILDIPRLGHQRWMETLGRIEMAARTGSSDDHFTFENSMRSHIALYEPQLTEEQFLQKYFTPRL